MTAHPHYLAMARYAEDAAISETPWEFWEYRNRGDSVWRPVNLYPTWLSSVEYRRKPRMVTVSEEFLKETELRTARPPMTTAIEEFARQKGYNECIRFILDNAAEVE